MEALTYRIEQFEGPLDLLLHLISKNKLNINDIELSVIVDQYIEQREQYMKERAQIEVLSNPGSFFSPLPEGSPDDGSLKMMLQKGCCFVCGREAKKGSPEWRHIESVLNRSKQIEESASVNDLHSFFGDIQKSVTSLTNVDEIKGDIAYVILQSNQLEGKIKKLKIE